MDHHALFTLLPPYTKRQALKELLSLGLTHPYFIEEGYFYKIGGFFKNLPSKTTSCSLDLTTTSINWDEQWQLHSPYYKEGLLHIDLRDFGFSLNDPFLVLKPGEGFGDLSHPTTALMLKAMALFIHNHNILDIGCGSGILSLAAAKALKTTILGIDIDDKAIKHSQENALLNNLPHATFHNTFDISHLNKRPLTILLNMIHSEQELVFASYPSLDFQGIFIISGILKTQVPNYLSKFPYPNFTLIETLNQEEWSCLILSNQLILK